MQVSVQHLMIKKNNLIHLGQDSDLLPQGVVMVTGDQRHDLFG